MNTLTLFETAFFMRMHLCYLHESTWMVHETLDDNGFYEIQIDIWSPRWMYEWMDESPLFYDLKKKKNICNCGW